MEREREREGTAKSYFPIRRGARDYGREEKRLAAGFCLPAILSLIASIYLWRANLWLNSRDFVNTRFPCARERASRLPSPIPPRWFYLRSASSRTRHYLASFSLVVSLRPTFSRCAPLFISVNVNYVLF